MGKDQLGDRELWETENFESGYPGLFRGTVESRFNLPFYLFLVLKLEKDKE